MRFKVANYSRLEIRLDTLHIYNVLMGYIRARSLSRPGCQSDVVSVELFCIKYYIISMYVFVDV